MDTNFGMGMNLHDILAKFDGHRSPGQKHDFWQFNLGVWGIIIVPGKQSLAQISHARMHKFCACACAKFAREIMKC